MATIKWINLPKLIQFIRYQSVDLSIIKIDHNNIKVIQRANLVQLSVMETRRAFTGLYSHSLPFHKVMMGCLRLATKLELRLCQ